MRSSARLNDSPVTVTFNWMSGNVTRTGSTNTLVSQYGIQT